MELARDPGGVIKAALDELSERSEVLAQLITEHGPYAPRRAAQPDLFASLAKAIIYQQLAGKAAAAIHRRFKDQLEAQVCAERVLALTVGDLRAAGLSGAKAVAVLDLAGHCADATLNLDELDVLDDLALTRSLCRVRGIGPWTAQMFLIFELGRLDVWPTGDLGVRKGFARAFAISDTPRAPELEPLGQRFRPFRSIVAWYCWRALDTSKPLR